MYRSLQNKSCVIITRTQNAPEGADYVNRLLLDRRPNQGQTYYPSFSQIPQVRPSARHADEFYGSNFGLTVKKRDYCSKILGNGDHLRPRPMTNVARERIFWFGGLRVPRRRAVDGWRLSWGKVGKLTLNSTTKSV